MLFFFGGGLLCLFCVCMCLFVLAQQYSPWTSFHISMPRLPLFFLKAACISVDGSNSTFSIVLDWLRVWVVVLFFLLFATTAFRNGPFLLG